MRWLRAPAKLNLTLRVVGRRADGYHELESLVAFAGLCDWLGFEPVGDDLALEVLGPRAREAGPTHEKSCGARRALARNTDTRVETWSVSTDQAIAGSGRTWRRFRGCGGRFTVARRRGGIASRRSTSASFCSGDWGGCPCLSFSRSQNDQGYRRRTRAGDSVA